VAVNRNFTDDVFNCLMAGTTPTRISLLFAIDIDVATLYLCLEVNYTMNIQTINNVNQYIF
jgi:hypothetical protein